MESTISKDGSPAKPFEIGPPFTVCLRAEADRLRSLPAFREAARSYCVQVAKLREAPRLLNAVIATDVRWRIVGYLLYLASDTERFGALGGATYSRLVELCVKRGEASPRALKTLLGLLKLSSLVSVVLEPTDGRVRYYQPTSKMDTFVGGWMGYAVAALDLLEPEQDRARFLDDPAFRSRFNVSGGRAHLSDEIPLMDYMPAPLADISGMSGSYSVLAGLIEADLLGCRLPSIGRLASRFGLSRSQVRNVLASAREVGLLAPNEAGELAPTPLLQRTFNEWIAIELAFYAYHMRAPGEPILPVRDTFFARSR